MLTPELGTTKVIYLKEDFQPSLVERNLTESQLRIFSGGKSCFKVKQHLMPARHKAGKALVSCLVRTFPQRAVLGRDVTFVSEATAMSPWCIIPAESAGCT